MSIPSSAINAILSNADDSYSFKSGLSTVANALFVQDWKNIDRYKAMAEDLVYSGVAQKVVTLMKKGRDDDNSNYAAMCLANWSVIQSSANEALVRMGTVDAVLPRIKNGNCTGLLCLMTAANLIGRDEEKGKALSTGPACVNTFLDVTEQTMNGRNVYGLRWSLEELLPPLRNLAINDENKTYFANDRMLRLLQDIVEQSSSAIAQGYAVLVLLELSFESSGFVTKSLQGSGIESTLRNLKGRLSLPEFNEGCDKLLWKLSGADQKQSARGTAAKTTTKKKVFVSYNWTYQDTIKEVVQALKDAGYEVWFDLEQMSGNIMDAMAEGIEECDVAVISICPEYKESANCRLEADYIVQEKKPWVPLMMAKDYKAKGWLGLMLGRKLWYDCSSVGSFQSNKAAILGDVQKQI